jgi:hypothetical protein
MLAPRWTLPDRIHCLRARAQGREEGVADHSTVSGMAITLRQRPTHALSLSLSLSLSLARSLTAVLLEVEEELAPGDVVQHQEEVLRGLEGVVHVHDERDVLHALQH